MKIKAPKWFVELYDEAQKDQDYVLDYLEKKVGYGKHWIIQNLKTCFSQITKEKKLEMMERMEKANAIINYAWAKFNYENWNKYKDRFRSAPERYDKKKKTIILAKPTTLSKFAKNIEKAIKKYEPKKRK
jgi:hypothetical protein